MLSQINTKGQRSVFTLIIIWIQNEYIFFDCLLLLHVISTFRIACKYDFDNPIFRVEQIGFSVYFVDTNVCWMRKYTVYR